MDLLKPSREKKTQLYQHGQFEIPIDMKIVLVWTALCLASILIPVVNQSVLRLILSPALILFIPGYVFLAALFPDSADIDTIERIILSIAISVVITPLIGLCLNLTPWGIRLDPLLITLTIFIVAMTLVAVFRRSSTPPESRYIIPIQEFLHATHDGWTSRNPSKRDRALFIAGILTIAVVVLSITFVITLPMPGEKFTEFYILGENRTADSYPTDITPGISYPMYVGIGNHEYRTVNYSVEIYLVPNMENKTAVASSVQSALLLKSYSITLSHNRTSVIPFDLVVPDAEYNRVDFLLFDEVPPSNGISGISRVNASYRNLHLWLNATLPSALNKPSAIR